MLRVTRQEYHRNGNSEKRTYQKTEQTRRPNKKSQRGKSHDAHKWEDQKRRNHYQEKGTRPENQVLQANHRIKQFQEQFTEKKELRNDENDPTLWKGINKKLTPQKISAKNEHWIKLQQCRGQWRYGRDR